MIDINEQVEKFKDFIEEYYKEGLYELISKGAKSLVINFTDLVKHDPSLAEQLLQDPINAIRAGEISLEQLNLPENNINRVRIDNIPESQKLMIRDIRSENLSKFISVEGIVRQASDVRPQVVSAKFECPSCGNVLNILQVGTQFREPYRCSCGRKGKFRLLSKDLVDAQRLVIEEVPETLEGAEQPKRLSIFLKEDLVEPKMEHRTTPGIRIRVNGILEEVPILAKTGGQSTTYNIILQSNYITPVEEHFEELGISKDEEKKIKDLAKNPKVYDLLASSIAPSIFGHEKIKEALLLQLFGGVKKIREDGTKTRGDMHVLLVGDPGAAKSSLLMYISKAAPKARFVSGKGSTSAGITASVVKDEFLRGWALEAGALVLANRGIVAIDELDKMSPEDRSAMHEALEQQQITISKANIQATLRAETTVLAAANPKLGRFDPFAPIAAQIDLPPTLINRFDLIFPIRDIPNREKDEKIASHVLALHKDPKTIQPAIDLKLFRKYIAYARQNIKPQLTQEALDEIKSFYVELRNSAVASPDEIKPIPISARQLEALVRLAESSAKTRLSNKVTKGDALRAIDLLKFCLYQVGFDRETGQIDIDRISTGITTAQRSKMVVVREIITDMDAHGLKSIPIQDIIEEAKSKGIEEDQVEDIIEKLKRDGSIFEPKRGFISKI